jgi:hypothetical protein
MRVKEYYSNKSVLLEYNRSITARHYGAKLIRALLNTEYGKKTLASYGTNEKELLDKLSTDQNLQTAVLAPFEEMDPTSNKEFTPWIINKFVNNELPSIDGTDIATYIKKLLTNFAWARGKKLLSQTDINRYSYAELVSKCDFYPEIADTKVLYNGPEGQFVIPNTVKASMELQKIGTVTSWCTADSRAPRHYPGYTSRGPLYVWIDHTGDKVQFHFPDGQFQKENNMSIRPEELETLLNSRPQFAKVFMPILTREFVNRPELSRLLPQSIIKKISERVNLDWARVIKGNPEIILTLPSYVITREMLEVAIDSDAMLLLRVPSQLVDRELLELAILHKAYKVDLFVERFPKLVDNKLLFDLMKEDYTVAKALSPLYWNQELVTAAVNAVPEYIKYVPIQYVNKELLLKAGHYDPNLFLISEFKEYMTPAVAMGIVKENGLRHFDKIPERLVNKTLLATALKYSESRLDRDGQPSAYVNREFLTKAYQAYPDLFTDDVIKIGIKYNSAMLRIMPDDRKTLEVCTTAVKKNPTNIAYVPEEFRPKLWVLALTMEPDLIVHNESHQYITKEVAHAMIKRDGGQILNPVIPKEFKTLPMYRLAAISTPSINSQVRISDAIKEQRKSANIFADVDSEKYPTLSAVYQKYGNKNWPHGENSLLTRVPINLFDSLRADLSKFSRDIGGRYKVMWRGKRAERRAHTKREEAVAFSIYASMSHLYKR